MPDSVKIGISSDYSGNGVTAAIGDLQKLETAGKGLSSQMFSATGVTQGWSQAQYIASFNAERLASRAQFLEQQVRSGNITTNQATAAWKGYTAEAKRAEWQAMTFGERYSVVSQRVNAGAKSIMAGITQLGLVTAGIGYAGKQVFEFAKSGAVIEYTAQKFDRLTASVGSTGSLFLTQLRTATRGTVSDFGLLQQGANLLQLGLASDTKEAVRLSSVMTALGMDTGELTLALANQSKRRLDQLGLSLTKFNEIEARLKDSGMNKQDAFKEAFLQTAEQTVMTTGNMADSPLGNFLRMQAAGANVIDAEKLGMADAPIVSDAANILQAMNAVQRGELQWTGGLGHVLTTNGPVLERGELPGQAPTPTMMSAGMRNYYGLQGYSLQGGRGRELYRGASDYAGMAEHYGGAISPGTGGTPPPLDYAGMLSGGLDLTKITEAYAEKTAELNIRLAEENDNLAEMTRKYGQNSEKVADQKQKIDELKTGMTDLGASATEAMNAWAMGALQAKGATEEQQYAFANASGMISDDAMEAYEANQKLADSFLSGKISADTYAGGVASLQNLIGTLDGKRVNTYIDVWIIQHGSTAYLSPNANTTTTNRNIEALRTGTGGGRWMGGPLEDGGPTVVGDAPGGIWTPYTEVIWGDHVFNNNEARMMRDAGLLDGADYAAGGSGGGSGSGGRTPRSSGGRARERSGLTAGSGTRAPRRTSSVSTSQTAEIASEVASTAAVVANQATNAATMAISTQQNTQDTMQQQTQQQVAAQQENTTAVVEKLDQVANILKKQANRDDMYALYRNGQMTSI
jgi:hypothetical protein